MCACFADCVVVVVFCLTCNHLLQTNRLASMDKVEVNHALGQKNGEDGGSLEGEMTTEMALVVIASALGSRIL
jgi:hypothetical protein